jgi:hypothetical protein
MKNDLNASYWEDRYKNEYTGWDIGYASTPLVSIIDSIKNKNARILIPGAGNSYEAEYAFNQGFKNVVVLDFAATALKNLKKRIPEFDDNQLIEQDFFEHSGEYDLILEQTFLCALNPSLREDYAKNIQGLLAPEGSLQGVLFNFNFEKEGPPFGGNRSDYLTLFKKYFGSVSIEPCEQSIPPRVGMEVKIDIRR